MTPRELFDAAVAARLEMPGLRLTREGVVVRVIGKCGVLNVSIIESFGKLCLRHDDEGVYDICEPASLADVECAVLDALALVVDGENKCVNETLPNARRWWVVPVHAHSEWVDIADCKWVVKSWVLCGDTLRGATDRQFPTRAAAFKAACDALAEERKCAGNPLKSGG